MKKARPFNITGGGCGAVVKPACLESWSSKVRPPLWHSSFKDTKCFFPAHSWRFNIVESLRDREVACSASDPQGSNFEFCVWGAVSSHLSQHPYMHRRFAWPGLAYMYRKVPEKPLSFYFISINIIYMYVCTCVYAYMPVFYHNCSSPIEHTIKQIHLIHKKTTQHRYKLSS